MFWHEKMHITKKKGLRNPRIPRNLSYQAHVRHLYYSRATLIIYAFAIAD